MGIGRALAPLCALLLALLLVPGSALADRTRVDWQRGLFIGRGIAVGDLRSPSRELARVKATRQARAQGRALLLENVGDLVWATGKKGSDRKKAMAAAPALEDAVFSLHADIGTDGSVVIDMALPLDALRALAFGPDQVLPAAPEGPAAIVIDARATGLTPALGYQLSDGSDAYRGPTLFFTSEADARAHASIGASAPLLVAQRSDAKAKKAGRVVVADGALKSVLAQRPLVAILWKGKK